MTRPPLPLLVVFAVGLCCMPFVLWHFRHPRPPWQLTIDGKAAGTAPYDATFLPVPVPADTAWHRFEAYRGDCWVRTAMKDHVIDYLMWNCSAHGREWERVRDGTTAKFPEPLPGVRFVGPKGSTEYRPQ